VILGPSSPAPSSQNDLDTGGGFSFLPIIDALGADRFRRRSDKESLGQQRDHGIMSISDSEGPSTRRVVAPQQEKHGEIGAVDYTIKDQVRDRFV
jgi:hypothetical protein